MRKFIATVAILLISASAQAQVGLGMGEVHISLNANAGAAPQTGTAFSIPLRANLITWIISFASAPASHSTVLEFSNDNSVWTTGDTSTNVNGETRTLFTAAKFIRATESARSGGGAITVTIVGKNSSYPGLPVIPTTYAVGDILYANSTTSLTRLPVGLQGRPLTVSAGLIPSWTDGIAMTQGILLNGAAFNAIGGGGYTGDSAAYYSIAGRGYWDATTGVNAWALNNAAGTAKVMVPTTAPTLSSGFCTSPALINGTASLFLWDVGSACATGLGVITIGATAPNGWHCDVVNLTNNATQYTIQTTSTTTTATFQNYVRTTGVAGNWTAGDDLSISCKGR